jgi:uncharacterized membrane protein YedE/YeeE
MKRLLLAFASGLLFGLGLLASGMTNPAKVQGFLDLFGRWDPSLAFVMGGAVALTSLGYALLRRRKTSFSGEAMSWSTATTINRPLILGGVLFGAGWGIAGFCPGPAVVALGAGMSEAWIFCAAMLAGMALRDWPRS